MHKKLQNFGLVFIVGEEVQFLSGPGSSQRNSTKLIPPKDETIFWL